MAAKKVLIFAPYGAWMVHHQLDAVIGAALAHRGCEVMVVLCDGFMQSCLIAGKPPSAEFCRSCAYTGEKVFSGMGLKIVQLRNLATAEDREAASAFSGSADPYRMSEVRYDRYPLGKWCPPSLQGYFASADFPLGQDWAMQAVRDQFSNGVLLLRILNRLMDQFRPDQMFSYNSTHYYYRIAFELGKERGLPVLVHERGHLNDSFTLLDSESTNANQGRFAAFRPWENVPLTAAECATVRTYFREREEGKNGFSRFYAFETPAEDVRRALRIPPGATVLALFGSGDRELGAFETVQCKTFAGQVEWIRATAEICRKRGWYLVVRHHPSNVIKGLQNYPFIGALQALNRELPDCVRVIMPHEKLTSYALLWNADGAVTHFSTMGSETPTRGVIGVCVGDSLYQPLGVEWAGTADHYEDALVASVEKTRAFGLENLRRAYRGAHYVVFRLGYKFQSFGIRDVFGPDIRVRGRDELGPGRDPILDRVCDYVISGKPLLPVPSEAERSRADDEEKAFLEGELLEVLAKRKAIQAAAGSALPSAVPLLTVFCVGGDPSGSRDKSLLRSREKSLERIDLNWSPRDGEEVFFAALAREASRARGRYVYVALPGVGVDESVFANSVDFLERPENEEVSGVAWGAWLADGRGKPMAEIFTDSAPAGSFEDALAAAPHLANPLNFLPLLVMRRAFLQDLAPWLDAMLGFGPREIAVSLFNLLHGPKSEGSMKRMTIPMLTLHPDPWAGGGNPEVSMPGSKAGEGAKGLRIADLAPKAERRASVASAPDASPAPAVASTPELPRISTPSPAILERSPDELRAELDRVAREFSRDPANVESGIACADILARLGEGIGARRVLEALRQRHTGDARFQPLLDAVEWKSRQGLAGVHEWGLRGKGYADLASKATVETWAEARPFVDSVPGWMLEGQEQFLFEKVKSLPDGAVILEMGADRGRSTSAMALACKGTRKRIFSIDTFAGNDGIMGKTYDFMHEWRDNLARLGVDAHVTGLQGYTFDVLPKWDRPIDFAFIDASHEYIDVLNDYASAYPYVKEGGWIAFHDVEPGWPGSWRVWVDFGIPMLTEHRTVATLACGRKAKSMPVRRPFTDGAAFSFARHWARHLEASADAYARQLAPALQASLDSESGSQADLARAREAERQIGTMPDHLKTDLRNMLAKDARMDGWLQYWQGLVLEAGGRMEEAERCFREARAVSYPAFEALVASHLRGPAPAESGSAHARASWFRTRLAGTETLLEYGCGTGALLRALPGRAKIGIEPDDRLRKIASIDAGIDAVNNPADLPDACADALVCDQALETATDPLALLNALGSKLKPGAKALISVGLRRGHDVPGDKALFAWTPATLANLLTAAGFRVLENAIGNVPSEGSGGRAGSTISESINVVASREQSEPHGGNAGPARDQAPAGSGTSAKDGDWAMVGARRPAASAASGSLAAGAKATDPRDIPVALVTYNRPAHARRVLDALASRGIRNLHIFVDGPKGNGDEAAVLEMRRLAESVSWTRAEVHALDRNRGLAKSVVAAAETLFSTHEQMVLLEDDCVPHRHCFDFFAKALDKYRDADNVFGISGYSVPMTPDLLARHPYDAYFCPRIGSWGWATWKRAWRLMETDLIAACRKALDRGVDLDQGGNDIRGSLEGMLQGHVKDVWTLNWVLTVYLHGGQFLYPMVSHIDNIGMDGSGVHCGATDKYVTRLAESPAARFPDRIVPDPDVLARFRSFYDHPVLQRVGP